MALVFFQKIVKVLGCNDNHTYTQFYTKKFFCFCWTVYTRSHTVFTLACSHFVKSPISLIDGLDSLCPDVDQSKHNEPFRFNTSTIVLKDNDRLGFYPNSNFIPKCLDIKSIRVNDIKSVNKVILDLAHGFHWSYILNPRFAHGVYSRTKLWL